MMIRPYRDALQPQLDADAYVRKHMAHYAEESQLYQP